MNPAIRKSKQIRNFICYGFPFPVQIQIPVAKIPYSCGETRNKRLAFLLLNSSLRAKANAPLQRQSHPTCWKSGAFCILRSRSLEFDAVARTDGSAVHSCNPLVAFSLFFVPSIPCLKFHQKPSCFGFRDTLTKKFVAEWL